MKLVHHTKS